MGNFHHKSLMVFAMVSAYTAPTLMTVCLLTNYWIYGNQTNITSNVILKPGDTQIVNYTYHRIGLWKECSRETNDIPYRCENAKYSKTEAKSVKGFKAVAYRSAPSMACFIAASGLLAVAILLFTRGLCKRRRKAVFFISGLLFSISGLLTMVGVTLYVSITTEESVKIDQDYRVMHSSYGFSFLCAILSFVLQELTGVLTVYWFIYRFRALVRKQERLRERTRQVMGNCFSMTTALPINLSLNHSDFNHPLISNDNHSRTITQRRRLPFESISSSRLNEKYSYSIFSFPQSTTLAYGDYCRVLIRAKDMDLLTRMVKSKSQAHLPVNSRPTTPAPMMNSKSSTQITRRNISKGVKRTTSV